MTDLNVQESVHGALIIVTLIKGKDEASVVTRFKNARMGPPKHVSIASYLKAGKSEQEALEEVLKIVKVVAESAHAAGLY